MLIFIQTHLKQKKNCPAPGRQKFPFSLLGAPHLINQALAQSQITTPEPKNFIIDDKTNPSVIITVAVAVRTFPRLGAIYTGAIGFNKEHPDNLATRMPADTITSRQAGYTLMTHIALKKALQLGIRRVVILSRSALITNIISSEPYTAGVDTQLLITKLIDLLTKCRNEKSLEITSIFCGTKFYG